MNGGRSVVFGSLGQSLTIRHDSTTAPRSWPACCSRGARGGRASRAHHRARPAPRLRACPAAGTPGSVAGRRRPAAVHAEAMSERILEATLCVRGPLGDRQDDRSRTRHARRGSRAATLYRTSPAGRRAHRRGRRLRVRPPSSTGLYDERPRRRLARGGLGGDLGIGFGHQAVVGHAVLQRILATSPSCSSRPSPSRAPRSSGRSPSSWCPTWSATSSPRASMWPRRPTSSPAWRSRTSRPPGSLGPRRPRPAGPPRCRVELLAGIRRPRFAESRGSLTLRQIVP